jgi:molybdopterin molybdotransferase
VTSSPLGWHAAHRRAHESVTALPAQRVPLPAAIGRTLAADLVALCDLPPADTSAMDGWAVCGPPPWTVVGRSLAGPTGPTAMPALEPMQARVIATGAGLPPGATGIVRTEHAVLDGDRVRLLDPSRRPDLSDLRPRGHEAVEGETLVPAGARVRPALVGLAAAAGHDELPVLRRPSVSVLVLGDELLACGLPRAGSVRDALGVQLPGWIEALGGLSAGVGRVPDDAGATREAVGSATADVVLTTGGSAAGAADHLRSTLTGLGARLVVDTVDVRPGHPMLLAELPDGRHVVGLPGNPLAALAGVVTLLHPLLAGLAGAPRPGPDRAPVAVDVPVHARGRRARGHLLIPVARVRDEPAGAVAPTGHAASAMLRGAARADGFLLVPPAGLRAGDPGEIVAFP